MWRWLLLLIFTLSARPGSAQTGPGKTESIQTRPLETWPLETRSPDTGLRIWEYPSADEGGFRLLIMVGVGSRDEMPAEAGISHFLEHCLFLSTEERTEKELIQGLRNRGGQANGQTTQDWTAYWVSVPVSEWRYGVDWLTEQIAKPNFAAPEVDRERGIVIEEINTLHEHGRAPTFEALLYGDHPLGRNIAGSPSSVGSIDQATLEGWYRKNYRLDNLVVAYAGDVPGKECAKRIQEQLSGMGSHSDARALQELHPRFGSSLMRNGMRPAGDRRGFIILGYLIEPGEPADLATLLLSETLLDDAIYDEIRSKRGLAYAPRAELHIHDAIWRFDCQIAVGEHNKLPSVLEGTGLAFSALSSTSMEDYARAQAFVLGSLRVASMQGLKRCTELTWAILGPDRAPDLLATVAQLDLDQYSARVSRLLVPERQFVISDSIDLINPSFRLFWIFIASLLGATVLLWWLPRHLRRKLHHRPRQFPPQAPRQGPQDEPVSTGVSMPKSSDVDEVERQFEDWFREQDKKDDE